MMLALRKPCYLCLERGAIARAYALSKLRRVDINKSTFFSFLDMNAQVHAFAYLTMCLRSCASFVAYDLVILRVINKAP